MKLQILSDLHLEFHRDGGVEFIDSLKGEADVLVLAGDVCGHDQIVAVLRRFCDRYPQVLYVHGNHEFYGSDRKTVVDRTLEAERCCPNLLWLDGDGVELEGRRFHGTPLWFQRDTAAPTWAINDFSQIRDYRAWVYEQNRYATQYLHDMLAPGDIVITHHLPSQRSVHPRYVGSPLNSFFVCALDLLIQSRRPALWIHGHTHFPFDYQLGETRIVCNPLGYPREIEPNFNDNLIIEV